MALRQRRDLYTSGTVRARVYTTVHVEPCHRKFRSDGIPGDKISCDTGSRVQTWHDYIYYLYHVRYQIVSPILRSLLFVQSKNYIHVVL